MSRNAERQAAFRARRKDQGGARIDMHVDASAVAGLKRLAAHHGVTQREMLEQLIADAEQAVTGTLDGDVADLLK